MAPCHRQRRKDRPMAAPKRQHWADEAAEMAVATCNGGTHMSRAKSFHAQPQSSWCFGGIGEKNAPVEYG